MIHETLSPSLSLSLPAFLATVVGARIAGSSWQWCAGKFIARRQRIRQQAFDFYVETGQKNQAFHSLARGTAQAAERQRLRRIAEKIMASREFSAWCKCPGCELFAVHSIEKTRSFFSKKSISCKRRCDNCGLSWKQH